MKKILFLLVTFLCIFLIYQVKNPKKINYVSIGDSLIRGINSFNVKDIGYNELVKESLYQKNQLGQFNNYFYNKTISGLLKDIQNNRTIWIDNHEYYIKKVLRESDIIVVSVGMEELFYHYDNKAYFDKMYSDIEKLILEIRKYAQGKIIFLGYFNPTNYYDSDIDEFFCNMDNRLNNILKEHNAIYISLYELVKENTYQDKYPSPFLNRNGYIMIARMIEKYLE